MKQLIVKIIEMAWPTAVPATNNVGHLAAGRLPWICSYNRCRPELLCWRPQLLPYLVVVHDLLDMATVLMIPTAV